MKRAFLFECNSDELLELIKVAVRQVFNEQPDKPVSNSPPLYQETEVLSPTEVCAILHVSRPTLAKYRRDGLLLGKKTSGKIFYKRSDVDNFLTNKIIKYNGGKN
ncbi:MAG: helix-turn-helix domain-containing protein [Bacteroidetes bacterium]|nr:helix-turn-helix domain-containing protein [Bacteroidota bacterium]